MVGKTDVSVSSGKCDFCNSTYSFVAGSMDKALAALKAAGYIIATVDGVTKCACPKDACHSDMRAWWGGSEQEQLDFDKAESKTDAAIPDTEPQPAAV